MTWVDAIFHDGMFWTITPGTPGEMAMYNQPPYNTQSVPQTVIPEEPSSPTDKSEIRRAFEVVRDVLQLPSLTDNERIILQMQYVFGHEEADVAASLVMTAKEYKKTRSEAFLKALAGDIRAKKHDG